VHSRQQQQGTHAAAAAAGTGPAYSRGGAESTGSGAPPKRRCRCLSVSPAAAPGRAGELVPVLRSGRRAPRLQTGLYIGFAAWSTRLQTRPPGSLTMWGVVRARGRWAGPGLSSRQGDSAAGRGGSASTPAGRTEEVARHAIAALAARRAADVGDGLPWGVGARHYLADLDAWHSERCAMHKNEADCACRDIGHRLIYSYRVAALLDAREDLAHCRVGPPLSRSTPDSLLVR
jgi:hypothetical protein